MSPTLLDKGPEGERDVNVGRAPRSLLLGHAHSDPSIETNVMKWDLASEELVDNRMS
jgi:hypothetical protein